MPEMKFTIGRPINGITINGLEYVRNQDDSTMLFDTKDDAVNFLKGNHFMDDEIARFVIEEEEVPVLQED